MIRLESVAFRVGAHRILGGVDLSVEAGEVVAIVGPNGAGKSTLLAIASGDFAPTEGRARLAARDVATAPDDELARERAVVRQVTHLSFDFRVLDVVLMGRSPWSRGRTTARDTSIARRALERVGLEAKGDRAFPTLSGGEKQRVHLARALAQIGLGEEGKALLLDEPTAALDPAHQHRVLAIARDVAARGLAVLAVLHDVNLAAQYADRVVVLADGRVAAHGAPSTIFTAELFREVFGVVATIAPSPWSAAVPLVLVERPCER